MYPFTMLNSDVIAMIKSFAGITCLDVADAVRELKREGIDVPSFKMRDLSELCFLIHHKCEKKSIKYTLRGNIRGEVGCFDRFRCLDRDHFLLAFKLLGYDYKIYDQVLQLGITEKTFSVAMCPLPPVNWGKTLKKLYGKKFENFSLMEFRHSSLEREKYEKMVLRRLF
jgi:hypothetical protein